MISKFSLLSLTILLLTFGSIFTTDITNPALDKPEVSTSIFGRKYPHAAPQSGTVQASGTATPSEQPKNPEPQVTSTISTPIAPAEGQGQQKTQENQSQQTVDAAVITGQATPVQTIEPIADKKEGAKIFGVSTTTVPTKSSTGTNNAPQQSATTNIEKVAEAEKPAKENNSQEQPAPITQTEVTQSKQLAETEKTIKENSGHGQPALVTQTETTQSKQPVETETTTMENSSQGQPAPVTQTETPQSEQSAETEKTTKSNTSQEQPAPVTQTETTQGKESAETEKTTEEDRSQEQPAPVTQTETPQSKQSTETEKSIEKDDIQDKTAPVTQAETSQSTQSKENETPIPNNNSEESSLSIWTLIKLTSFLSFALMISLMCYYRYQLEKYKIPPFTPPKFLPEWMFPKNFREKRASAMSDFYKTIEINDYHPPELSQF